MTDVFKDYLEKNFPTYLVFKRGQIVVAILDKSVPRYITPVLVEEVKCPTCSGREGYPINNNHEIWWACENQECKTANTTNSHVRNENVPLKKFSPKQDEISIPEIMERIGVPELYQNASFDDWSHSEELKEDAMNFLKNPKGFCLLTGSFGRGKTHIACCMLSHLTHSNVGTLRFLDIIETKYKWLEEMRSNGPKMLSTNLSKADFLVIDDIDKVNPTDSFFEFVFLVINSRHNSKKPTVITTNKSFKELSDHFGSALSSRLFSRDSLFLMVDGVDLRQ